ncbi:MAG: NCS2 family permease [Verrucomicrobiota bacterium]
MFRSITRGEVDGFFGLFIDNLLQLLLIVSLCPLICGLPLELVTTRILPAAGISILFGNLYYGWQARRLARKQGRSDVTALPYGINTVSLIAYIFLIMGPVYRSTSDIELTWKMGLFACLMSGIIELIGALVGKKIRQWTPRAALLSSLSGIAITFITMGFVFQIFSQPLIAILPMLIIVTLYAARIQLPLKLPVGLVAVLTGTLLAWLFSGLGWIEFTSLGSAATYPGLYLPRPISSDILRFFFSGEGWTYLAVIIPMGLFNVIGSLQCLESAEAAGDDYPTGSSLAVNGVGTIVAALLGSAFPTTIYIGHPGWKAMGARHAYSSYNGVIMAILCCTGIIGGILYVVPLEVMIGILVWIGLTMAAQAFQETPKRHSIAVAMGLLPSLAAWALLLIETSLSVSGTSLSDAVTALGSQLYLRGVIALSQGFIITSMILASIVAHSIDKHFRKAACWAAVAATLSASGLIHGYELTESGISNQFGFWAAGDFTVAYLLAAGFLFCLDLVQPRPGS